MIHFLVTALAASGVASPPPQNPPSIAAIVTPDAQLSALSEELAELLNSRDQLLQTLTSDGYAEALKQRLMAVPDFAKAEMQHPGLAAFVVQRVQPVLAEAMIKELPDVWHRIAAIYAAQFNPAELTQVLAFLRSPIGTKTRNILNGKIAAATIASSARGDAITKDNMLKLMGDAGVALLDTFSVEERQQLLRFLMSPIGSKLRTANTAAAGAMEGWANEPHPQVEHAILPVMKNAAVEFLHPGSTKS